MAVKKKYKKPSKPCARKRRNRTRVVNPTGRSPRVRWLQTVKPIESGRVTTVEPTP